MSAGTATIGGNLVLGNVSVATGNFNLSGTGTVNVSNAIYVGNNAGTGIFTQTGGSATFGAGHLDELERRKQ